MKTLQEREQEEKQKQVGEAKRLLNVFNREQALFFCEELAKKLPNINLIPPAYREASENYSQFYSYGVPNEIKILTS